MLSIVATRRSADSRSDAMVPSARQATLNSSISAIAIALDAIADDGHEREPLPATCK